MEKLTAEYEVEQKSLDARIVELRGQLAKLAERDQGLERFMALVRKHASIKRLTAAALNEFIDHIVVYQAEHKDGRWLQTVEIHYSFVGLLEMPEDCELPEAKVVAQTRKGVRRELGTQLDKVS
jgi:hypothetical protein